MVQCSVCGATVSGSTCGLCGSDVSVPSPDGPQWSVQPAAPVPAPEAPPSMPKVTHRVALDPLPETPKQETPVVFIAGVAALAVALVGFFAAQALKGGDEEPASVPVAAVQTTSWGTPSPSTTTTEAVEESSTESSQSDESPSSDTGDSATNDRGPYAKTDGSQTSADSGSSSEPMGEDSEPLPSASQTEAASLKALYDRYAMDVQSFTPDGRWLAQLSSKWVGIVDERQSTESGSHTFMAADIVFEVNMATRAHGDVRLLKSTDFGEQKTYPAKPAGEPLWVTVYDPGTFGSESDVRRWCENAYSLTGDALKNVCLPRQARAPFGG